MLNKLLTSLQDTKELRQMIIDNPDLPLVIFAGEYAWTDMGYGYELTDVKNVEIKDITKDSRNYYCDEEEYRDSLYDEMSDNPEYKNMTDSDFEAMIDDMVDKAEFTKCIVVYVD